VVLLSSEASTQNLQFALHYSWSTEARARRALANISTLLRPGGTFIGTMPDANVIIKKLREGFCLVPFKYFQKIRFMNFDQKHNMLFSASANIKRPGGTFITTSNFLLM
jgi:mRNA (guanine-N7-)-methyltransferase